VTVFRFIAAEKAEHSIETMCRVLGVSSSGFHAWAGRPPCPRDVEDAYLIERIQKIHAKSRKTYGARRVHAMLARAGICVGKKRVERLMRLAGVSGLVKRKRGRTTISVPGVRTAPDLVERDFYPDGPDQLWVADITYLRSWEGWLYLAVVLDCYSRRCVGFALGDHLRSELVVDALGLALARRRPAPGLVHHADQGSQYVSLLFTERCAEAGIEVSMGSQGDCFDNALCEAFMKTLKWELVDRQSWPTKAELRAAVFEWIEVFYNRERIHSRLGYRSPAEFEMMMVTPQLEAALA
jgi:putative transposase